MFVCAAAATHGIRGYLEIQDEYGYLSTALYLCITYSVKIALPLHQVNVKIILKLQARVVW